MAWLVIPETNEQQRFHFAPLFGPEHIPSPDCWCHPEPDEKVPCVMIHNVMN